MKSKFRLYTSKFYPQICDPLKSHKHLAGDPIYYTTIHLFAKVT